MSSKENENVYSTLKKIRVEEGGDFKPIQRVLKYPPVYKNNATIL